MPVTNGYTILPVSLWRRLAAMIYDSFLILAIMFFVGFLNLCIQMYLYGEEQLRIMTENGESLGGPLFYLSLFLSIFSFFAYCWTRRGQTLGMQAWGLVIQSGDGTSISMKQSLVRWLTAFPAILLFGLGLVWCLFDKQQRTWQDLLSQSLTVHHKKTKAL